MRVYHPIVEFVLRHQWSTIVAAFFVVAVTFAPRIGVFEKIGSEFMPPLDQFDTGKSNVSLEGLGLNGVSAETKEGARASLDMVDDAIKGLVGNRAELGALQNRLQSSINNLNIYDENLSTARSRIRDSDMASETADLAKNNILTQAGISVLSQANQNNMAALKLLG